MRSGDYCGNCHYPLTVEQRFCPDCGQKKGSARISMQDLFRQLWVRLFMLEGRYYRVLWHLLVPGKVAHAYFQGKHKRYPSVLQLFFVLMFLFVTIGLKLPNTAIDKTFGQGSREFNDDESPVQIGMNAKLGEPPNEVRALKLSSDKQSKRRTDNLYEAGREAARIDQLKRMAENLPDSLQSPEAKRALIAAADTLRMQYLSKGDNEFIYLAFEQIIRDSMPIQFGLGSVKVSTTEFFTNTPEQFFEKHPDMRWLERIALRQAYKTFNSLGAFQRAMLGSIAWTVLALSVWMSLILKLLYMRRRLYYVEHLVFLIMLHNGFLVLMILSFILQSLNQPVGYLYAWMPFSALWAMKRFYAQAWFKTLVKWGIFSLFYLSSALAFFILAFLLAFVTL